MSLGGTSGTALLPFQQPDQLTSPHRHCPRWQGSSQPAASFLFPSLCFRSRQTRAWRGAAAGVGVGFAARWVLRLPPGVLSLPPSALCWSSLPSLRCQVCPRAAGDLVRFGATCAGHKIAPGVRVRVRSPAVSCWW